MEGCSFLLINTPCAPLIALFLRIVVSLMKRWDEKYLLFIWRWILYSCSGMGKMSKLSICSSSVSYNRERRNRHWSYHWHRYDFLTLIISRGHKITDWDEFSFVDRGIVVCKTRYSYAQVWFKLFRLQNDISTWVGQLHRLQDIQTDWGHETNFSCCLKTFSAM